MEQILGQFNRFLEQRSLMAVPFAFLGGVLASFTPCVYPMIPVVVGVIGARSSRSRMQGFLIVCAYVLGLSLVYAALGVISGLTGQLFGGLSANVFVNLAVGVLFVIFGLSMYGLFDISFPGFVQAPQARGRGLGQAFIVGIGSGFVAAPCTAPVVGSLLAYIGSTHDAVLGMITMFAFALGMSVLLLAVGFSAGVVAILPKSGLWLERIKQVLAVILMMVGLYFVFRAGQFAG